MTATPQTDLVTFFGETQDAEILYWKIQANGVIRRCAVLQLELHPRDDNLEGDNLFIRATLPVEWPAELNPDLQAGRNCMSWRSERKKYAFYSWNQDDPFVAVLDKPQTMTVTVLFPGSSSRLVTLTLTLSPTRSLATCSEILWRDGCRGAFSLQLQVSKRAAYLSLEPSENETASLDHNGNYQFVWNGTPMVTTIPDGW